MNIYEEIREWRNLHEASFMEWIEEEEEEENEDEE